METYQNKNNIIRETIREFVANNFINESAQDKAAIRFLKSKGVDDYEEQKRVLGTLKHDIPNLRLDKGKFVVAALRMYYDGELRDGHSISSFDKALSYIHKGNHAQEYDFDLNGLSLTELNNKYSDLIKQDLNSDIERSNNVVFSGTSDYKIIPIRSYEEASEYGKYTSWCVTHGEDAYDSYTKGGKRFYFCLKNGFENLPETAGENAPLDEYGLSMISVLVDMDGSLDRLTTRWNHNYDGENNPGLSTPEQLEKVLNLPFYKTFKAYTRDELHAMGIIPLDEVQELLDSGEKPEEIFDGVYNFYEDFAVVELNGKSNFINREGKILSPNQWFDHAGDFSEEFCIVELNGKRNFINTKGKILSPNQWFDHVGNFSDGIALVKLNGKWHLINTKGVLFNSNKNPLNENKKQNKQYTHNVESIQKRKATNESYAYTVYFDKRRKDFVRRIMNIPDLTQAECNSILAGAGVKPVEYKKGYGRYDNREMEYFLHTYMPHHAQELAERIKYEREEERIYELEKEIDKEIEKEKKRKNRQQYKLQDFSKEDREREKRLNAHRNMEHTSNELLRDSDTGPGFDVYESLSERIAKRLIKLNESKQ